MFLISGFAIDFLILNPIITFPLFLALKWFWCGVVCKTFPRLVTRNLLVKDLLVLFVGMSILSISMNGMNSYKIEHPERSRGVMVRQAHH